MFTGDVQRLIDETLADTRYLNRREQVNGLREQLRTAQGKALISVSNMHLLGENESHAAMLKEETDNLIALRAGIARLVRIYERAEKALAAEERAEKDKLDATEAKPDKNGDIRQPVTLTEKVA